MIDVNSLYEVYTWCALASKTKPRVCPARPTYPSRENATCPINANAVFSRRFLYGMGVEFHDCAKASVGNARGHFGITRRMLLRRDRAAV